MFFTRTVIQIKLHISETEASEVDNSMIITHNEREGKKSQGTKSQKMIKEILSWH